jgi:hypothetical protein
MGADVWFWNSIENTLTLKQTITGSDGSVSTQVREINDHDPNRNFNGGEFTNYTNVHIEGSNTQTDFTIRTELYNETAGTTYDNYHRGPDVDNVTLNITYRDIPPIDDDTQEAIDDIDEDINDIVENIPDDFDWINEDITEIPDFSIPEEEFTIPFDEEFAFDDIYIDELPPIEEFDMEVFEEMPVMEEVFFEEDFSMEPPPAMIEEVFTEEFEEDFTEFLEETGMEEEFMEFLEDEGITAEEFFEEITEEEFDDELTEESFEEFEEPMEEVSTEKESVQETVEDEKETMEEKEVAQDEATEEEEPNSTESEESEVSAENSGEQETIQSEKVDTKDGVVANVRDTENKLKKNLKAIAKQIAKVTKETTQNLTKEDLFFKNNTLDAYNKTEFYKSKDVYVDQNLNLFNQIDLASYSQEIYTTVSLSSYVQNDPVEVHTKKLNDIADKKRKLLIELEALKQ